MLDGPTVKVPEVGQQHHEANFLLVFGIEVYYSQKVLLSFKHFFSYLEVLVQSKPTLL